MPLFPPEAAEAANQPNHGIQDKLTIGDKTYVLRGSNPTDTPSSIEWQDQNGATAGSVQYDTAATVSLTAIGPALAKPLDGQTHRFPVKVGSAFTYREKIWQVADISETGVYNDLTTWAINLRRWANWPAASDTDLPRLVPSDGSAALPCGPAVPPSEPESQQG